MEILETKTKNLETQNEILETKKEAIELGSELPKGNTKTLGSIKPKRITPSKRWCFTLNNYTEEHKKKLFKKMAQLETKYIFGYEVGASGTPHIQGYIEFKIKTRPLEAIKIPQIHWEKCKGNRDQNITYCSKDRNYETNFVIVEPEEEIKVIQELRPWQSDIVKILLEKPNDRHIYWIWEEKGKVGKSALCKKLCLTMNALICEGKSSDIFNSIYNYKKEYKRYPRIILIDCPRSNVGYMNYGALEKIKNGLIFNSKYESKMMIFNTPHVVVFANDEPAEGKYSEDRLIIKKINSEGLEFEN